MKRATVSPPSASRVSIRKAKAADASALARLAAQLGYRVSRAETSAALKNIARDRFNDVFVAQDSRLGVVGWIQLFEEHALAGSHRVEVAGLVVDAECRGAGVGRRLMDFAERWGRKRRCGSVYLRTNVKRAAAHIFYERLGYSHIKTQKAYRKLL